MGHFNVDLLIAAIAIEHGLAVVTRNVRHFEPTEAKVLNPFDNLDLPLLREIGIGWTGRTTTT